MDFELISPECRKCRILIIEDEALIALDTSGYLLEWGYEVCGVAASVCDALHQAERSRPDVALVDVQLRNGGDGVAAARLIRERWNVAVVFLTGQSDRESHHKMLAIRPAACLFKPYTPSELKTVVAEASAIH